jgi:amidohydrolase
MPDIHRLVNEQKDRIIGFRRDLHRIPETAYTEKKTAAYVADVLRREGLDVQTGIAETGVVGLLETGKPGPTVLIRSDMDALPISEETGLDFSSTHPGIMHACGHDAHMAMLLGSARTMAGLRDDLSGNIKFLYQPAEEGPGGAKQMIDAGVVENPKVDFSLGCHVWPDIPEGTVGVKTGRFMAAMNRFNIKILGKGGHGAMPHTCVDALEVGTQVVAALQRIVSRHLDPMEPAVVTIGMFNAGTAFNVIPDNAAISGTTRTFNEDTWRSWETRLRKLIGGVCDSMGADFEFTLEFSYPPVINDDFVSDVVRRCAKKVVGESNVLAPPAAMVGEDFAFFQQKSKGCFFALGVGRENGASLHTSRFDFNEDVLMTGVETYCRVCLALLT